MTWGRSLPVIGAWFTESSDGILCTSSQRRSVTPAVTKPRRPIPHQSQSVKPKTDTVAIAFIHPGQMSAYFTTSLLATMLYDVNGSRHVVGLLNEWSSVNDSAPRDRLTDLTVAAYPTSRPRA